MRFPTFANKSLNCQQLHIDPCTVIPFTKPVDKAQKWQGKNPVFKEILFCLRCTANHVEDTTNVNEWSLRRHYAAWQERG